MAEFGLGEFLEVIVEQPGMVHRRLQDQRLPQRDRRAMAAMQRARRKLRARHHISFVAAQHRGREAISITAAARPAFKTLVVEVAPARRIVFRGEKSCL